MPAKKKTTKKKAATKKKTTAKETSSSSASGKSESSVAFWVALLILALAVAGGVVISTSSQLAEEQAQVPEPTETAQEEEVDPMADLSLPERIEALYDEQGQPAASVIDAELQTAIERAIQRGELVEVQSTALEPLDTYTVYAVPTKDVNQGYCGVYGQRLCLVVRQQNVNTITVLDVLEAQASVESAGGGTVIALEQLRDHVLLQTAFGDAGTSRMWAKAYNMNTNAVTDLGRVFTQEDTPIDVAVGDVNFDIEVESEIQNDVLVLTRFALVGADGAVDLTQQVQGAGDYNLTIDWQAAIDRPGEIAFSVYGRSFIYNRDGNGTFIEG